ncbi:MAG: acyl-CoA dehydrogenase family protein [Polyangiaceae bacterium]|nr:acyl-CoA dehydrogenase family protein [Polyangiaceae bacterium]
MFDWNDEHKQIRAMFRQFIRQEIAPQDDAMEAGEPPYAVMRKLTEMLGIRERVQKMLDRAARGESSGRLASQTDPYLAALLAIELSRQSPGFALAFGAALGLCGQTILRRGTLAQQQRWGAAVMCLDKIGCWAITEPDSGSDAFAMRTTAKKVGDGRYVLSGSKTFITNAPYADVLVVYAKLVIPGEEPGSRPPQAFVLERGMPGLSTGKPLEKMGMHSSPTGEIFLEDVEATREHLLGERESEPARGQVVDVFKGERTGVAHMCLGIIERVLEDSLAYAKARHTWGSPIASYQLVQEKLARMMIARSNVKNIVMKQLFAETNGVDISLAEASAQKLYCTRATTDVCLEAIQIHGGNGYMREYQVERFMRDAKLLQIGGGTDEIQILHVAQDLIANGLAS